MQKSGSEQSRSAATTHAMLTMARPHHQFVVVQMKLLVRPSHSHMAWVAAADLDDSNTLFCTLTAQLDHTLIPALQSLAPVVMMLKRTAAPLRLNLLVTQQTNRGHAHVGRHLLAWGQHFQ